MCGIFGTISIMGKKEEKLKCLQRLAHRGPDGEGEWEDELVYLGHRRLAILDLNITGKQPMQYADGRYVITYNGEIFNFVELRHELEQKGYHFISETDTEVVLASYCEWGDKCLDKFNGMWAFAIYDRKEKKMFLARDRYGVKPLFYTRCSGGFAFASEMKALTPIMEKHTINETILHWSTTSYETTEECLIKEIKRLLPGNCIYFDCISQNMTIKEWYSPLEHIGKRDTKNYEDQVEEFRELFLNACKIRMRSDVPIGTALSGGLDSSSTISAMSHIGSMIGNKERVSKNWQHAFIASMPDTSQDETQYARDVAKYLEIKDTVVEIDPVKYWDKIGDYLYLFEEIYSTSPVPMMALYGEERKAGIVVTIDGHGADEMYGGYPFNYIHAFRDAKLKVKQINQIADAYIDAFPESGNTALSSRSKAVTYIKYILQNAKKEIKEGNVLEKLYASDDWKGLDYLNKVLYRSTFVTILPTLLRNYDRYSMANGVEIRMPFMDYRLVEKAFSWGWDTKVRNGYSKSIIRDAMAPYMPEHIAYRKGKIGFNTPILEWMQGDLKEWFMDEVHSRDFRECGLIDSEALKNEIHAVINNEHAMLNDASSCWSKISPYLWEKYFYKKL